MNMNKRYIEHLKGKGFKDSDDVCFNVENQYSGGYVGPLNGKLRLNMSDSPLIECINNGEKVFVTVNKGYDAYINTIRHDIDDGRYVLDDGAIIFPKILEKLRETIQMIDDFHKAC